MLYLLTPTGGRPEGLALLAQYLNAQTWTGPARWVIVDDMDPATPVPAVRDGIEVEVVRPCWRWAPGQNTQAACMAAGLTRIPPGAIVLVLEDDDAYLPGHVVTLLRALAVAELVGERVARYYNVVTGRHRVIPGTYHASLASVGLRGRALDRLRDLCAAGSQRIDMDLWRTFQGPRSLLDSANVVGIKGLPGRPGIGVGHRPDFGDPDPDGRILAEWLGPALADAYAGYRRV